MFELLFVPLGFVFWFLKDLTTLCLTLHLVLLEAFHDVFVLFVVFVSLAVALLVLIDKRYLLL